MTSISLTMIVRNEADVLARCLDSAKGAYDQLVVIDTGSTDETMAIAHDYGAHVREIEWRDDFAYARNFALDCASGDWWFWLDADDVLVEPERLRTLAEIAPADLTGYFFPYVLGRNAIGQPTYSYSRDRLIRNNRQAAWTAPVHEALVYVGPTRFGHDANVLVEHQPLATKAVDVGRNLRILRKAQENGPLEPRMLFYLARELRDVGLTNEALAAYGNYLFVSIWEDERYQALIDMARLMGVDGGECLDDAMHLRPNWPAAYFGYAWIAYLNEDWQAVIRWCDVGRSLPMPDTGLFVEHRALTYDWLILIAYASFQLGRIQQAMYWTRHALSIEPTDPQHLANLAYGASLGPEATADGRPVVLAH